MGKLDSLRIDDCPFAFASFAAKHNALVDLLAGMVGQNGIDVVMAEKNAIIRANIAAGPAGPSGNVAGNTANVVGSTGILQNVYVGNVIATAYPTALGVVTGTANTHITGSGVAIEVISLGPTTPVFEVNQGSYTIQILADGKFKVNGTQSLILDPAALASSSMAIREIDVCDAGVAKKMLVVASDPY